MADLAQAAVRLVQPQDDRAQRALGLPRTPAEHDRVDRPNALDLHHPDALARAVRRVGLLGDHALLGVQPAGGVLSGPHHWRELHALKRGLLERGPALAVREL